MSTAIAVIVLAVMPLTSAYVPDPIWIAGIWDGGDADNLVAVLSGADVLADSGALILVCEGSQPADSPRGPATPTASMVVLLPENRAPPLA